MTTRDPADLHHLQKVSGDKKVVLGLITTKDTGTERQKKKSKSQEIHEAAKYVPLDRLYLSPQCGFASCEIGNKLTEEEQWAKLKTGERNRRRGMEGRIRPYIPKYQTADLQYAARRKKESQRSH